MTQILEPPTAPRVPHRFTGEQYRKMYDLGVFGFDQRSELIAGEVFFMAAMGTAHYQAIRVFNRLLVSNYGGVCDVIPQCPIRLFDDTEPEPDFALIRLETPIGVAEAQDVLLAIEVSDSTLFFDRNKKLPQYAESSIPESWILNLVDQQLEVYRLPQGQQYLQRQVFLIGQAVAPLFSPDSSLAWWTALSTPPTGMVTLQPQE